MLRLDFTCVSALSLVPLFLLSQRIESSGVSFLAGSLSLLSITSGMSSEGIAPSVGRYGWVAMRPFCRASFPGAERLTDLSPLVDLFRHAHCHSRGCNTLFS
jgi:hypothetical protein